MQGGNRKKERRVLRKAQWLTSLKSSLSSTSLPYLIPRAMVIQSTGPCTCQVSTSDCRCSCQMLHSANEGIRSLGRCASGRLDWIPTTRSSPSTTRISAPSNPLSTSFTSVHFSFSQDCECEQTGPRVHGRREPVLHIVTRRRESAQPHRSGDSQPPSKGATLLAILYAAAL